MRNTRTLGRLMIGGLVWLVATACVEETPAIFIVQNNALGDQCEVTNTAAAGVQGSGTMDLTVARSYRMNLFVENLMNESGANSLGTATGGAYEGNRVTFTNAVVSVIGPPNLVTQLPENQQIPISGTLEPGGSAVVQLDVIGATLGQQLSAEIPFRGTVVPLRAQVQFTGLTTSGTEVFSNVFNYPLDVCRGCLLEFPPESVSEADPLPNCLATPEDSTELPSDCAAGQDSELDCRVCRNILESTGANPLEVDAQCEPAPGL